jgi:hypothetical protein
VALPGSRHCERSEAIQAPARDAGEMLECFAALAMTGAVADFVFLIRDFEENVHALDS